MQRPRILHVSSEVPWPLNSGGHLRTYHLAAGLGRHCDLHMVAGDEGGEPVFGGALVTLHRVSLPPRTALAEAWRFLRARAAREAYAMYRRHDRAEMWAALGRLARESAPDVLFLDHLDSWQYRSVLPQVPVVIDLHNAYSTLAARMATEQQGLAKRALLRSEARLLERVERRAVAGADLTFAVSEEERRFFEGRGARRVVTVPNGVDCAAFSALPAGRGEARPEVLFLGTMSWPPNAEAARFLAVDVLPAVRRALPDATLRIVGRDPGPLIASLANLSGVEVTGAVPEIVSSLRDAAVLAVPLASGGGTRLKILEAFAAGLPVVSTAVGCEGIHAQDGTHLLVRERTAFAEALVQALTDRTAASRRAESARALARATYDWPSVADAAMNAIRSMLREEGRLPEAGR